MILISAVGETIKMHNILSYLIIFSFSILLLSCDNKNVVSVIENEDVAIVSIVFDKTIPANQLDKRQLALSDNILNIIQGKKNKHINIPESYYKMFQNDFLTVLKKNNINVIDEAKMLDNRKFLSLLNSKQHQLNKSRFKRFHLPDGYLFTSASHNGKHFTLAKDLSRILDVKNIMFVYVSYDHIENHDELNLQATIDIITYYNNGKKRFNKQLLFQSSVDLNSSNNKPKKIAGSKSTFNRKKAIELNLESIKQLNLFSVNQIDQMLKNMTKKNNETINRGKLSQPKKQKSKSKYHSGSPLVKRHGYYILE